MAQYHFDLGINSYISNFKTRHLVYFADDKQLKKYFVRSIMYVIIFPR